MCTPRAIHGLDNPYSVDRTRCGRHIAKSVVDDEKDFVTCRTCMVLMKQDTRWNWARGAPLRLVCFCCTLRVRDGRTRYRAIAEGLPVSVVEEDGAWVVERQGLYDEMDYFETWQMAARMAERRLLLKARTLLAMLEP